MSKLSNKTERKAILRLAKCLPYFEALNNLEMSGEDAFFARSAENLIKGIIETNGYAYFLKDGKRPSIFKVKEYAHGSFIF